MPAPFTTLLKALQELQKTLIKPLQENLKAPGSLVIDGTLIPTCNWRSLGRRPFSGKHKRSRFNHQIICTLDGKPLSITDPLPGARDNAHAFRVHSLDQLLDLSTLADKGHIGLGLAIPSKRYKARKTPLGIKAVNKFINSCRAVVKQVIAQVKTWRGLDSIFRQPLSSYLRVFGVVRGWGFYETGGTFE